MSFLLNHPECVKKLATLEQHLVAKSEELNLFSAGDRAKLGEKHFPDALEILNVDDSGLEASGQRVLDLGTGGGIPGLVLAAARPDLHFTLCDAREKKVRAVLEVAAAAGLDHVQGLWGRFEDLAHEARYRGHFDVVVARAVASLPTLLEYASGFLKVGGVLLAWKGPEATEELEASRSALAQLRMEYTGQHDYALTSGESRTILRFVQNSKTPAGFPRHPDLPKSKPLR